MNADDKTASTRNATTISDVIDKLTTVGTGKN
jgi:hypothetical protein